MGNQLDRITHVSYSELPTGDPAGLEKEELRVGVAYFFSDEEEEPEDAYQDEVEYSAFCRQDCIFSQRRGGEDLRVHAPGSLLAMCQPGDLLELVARAQPPHWAIYVRDDQVIHLHQGQIRMDSLRDVSGGRPGRIVNHRYRYRPLPPDLVLQNARGHLGLSSPDVCWTNSESFAAWCRFGKREFKAGGEAPCGQQRYCLKVRVRDGAAHTRVFRSLDALIRERRRVDAGGVPEEEEQD
ncbi:protein FAM84A-like [Denticeps clupeoides]|uniref:protein LRATD1 n=1 Tax=Denticeps clupeoides TaxID=299321 RepID=UPI0010A58C28|nr:protein FAM84A [Denticeps clupeoides]XP_028823822.1 protein FAM84A-like [Denticeps clupeoides]